jgi:hypothetical protein
LTPSAFISAIGPGAKQSNIDTGIPASITIAQAALDLGGEIWSHHASQEPIWY